jgi:hypothetical protein
MRRLITFLAATIGGSVIAYGCSSSNNNAGSPGDAGLAEAATHKDATGPYDSSGSGGDDSSATTCPTPADMSSWKPPAYVPAKHQPGACSAQQISDFDKNCLNASSKSTAACDAFRTASATCVSCLVTTTLTDATWGPLVVDNGTYQGNIGGCLELAAPGNASCAQAQQAMERCAHAACDGPCPVTDQASFSAFQQCVNTADQEACSQYVTAANCLTTIDASAAAACIPSQNESFDTLYMALAPFFCGGTADGGAAEAGAAEGGPEAGSTDAAGDAKHD